MATTNEILEQRIAEWRDLLSRRPAIHAGDVDELEEFLDERYG